MLIISTIITLVITGIIGYLSKSKVKTSKDFTSGGNKLGVMGVTSVLMGSIIGGASTVGTAQMAYNRGIGAIWFILGLSIASIILGLFYSKQVDKKSAETIPQIIGNTYGKKARTVSSILLSIGMFIHINGQIIACTALFTVIFGMSITKTAVIVVCLLVVYVVFGGFWGSTMVGAVKTILLYGTSIICGILLIFKFNGIRDITSVLPQEPWFNLFSGGVSSDLASGISTIVGVLSTQTYFQSIMAGKNSKTSRRGAFLVAFLVLPVGIVCTMIGMYMKIHHPSIVPSEAFPLFLMTYLNPVLGGVCIATVLISSIATGAGLTLGIATMFVRDIYNQCINKKAGDKKQLYILRGTIIFIGIMTLIIVINNKDSMILDWGFLSMIFRSTPIFIPVFAAMFFKDKIRSKAGIYSIVAGPLASLIWILSGLGKINSIYIGLTISIFVLWGMSKFYKSKPAIEDALHR
ncbi:MULTISPECIES: sodium:solute symporter [Clostridium]|uniref:sodium:solute symporter family protein n=1 Tax=Clostridium TaxID=1485 RepID=UPI0013E91690|nr:MULTISPECIES: sodium:solute symporter family protein [Clostridium]MBW9157770.1 sodium:solute symporter family protein [Clostridium tagluense]MBZ9635236.1 sodium:solute symporter family protein [Clostridium sp. FP1]WLC63748.1 sodium:solute symporter family protein [Clostridium tagluense]